MRSIICGAAAACVLVVQSCAPDVGIKPLPHATTVSSPTFRLSAGSLLGAGFTPGNRIATYENGDAIFPAMLAGIRSAKRSITFETYIYHKGEIPRAFAEALAERARAGVKVLAIVDAQGGSKVKEYQRMLEDAGVRLVRYHHAWHPDLFRYNNRTHRKLLVIDGKIAYIGGVGIAKEWEGNAQSPDHWRDNHYRVEGPAVAQAQAAFADNWLKTKKEILTGADFFPSQAPRGSALASIFYASPRHASFNVAVMYHLAISSAARSIYIQNAYFVPDEDMVRALINAARRGVRVVVVLPGHHIDHQAVRRASRKRWKPLLEAGVEIFEYQPTMLHSKLLIVDDHFVSVGSANFDNRSLHLNDEANLNVLDRHFAASQVRMFQRDLAKTRRMTLENYREAPVTEAVIEVVQSPIEGQL
jgi:cardiolipin synthase A/B